MIERITPCSSSTAKAMAYRKIIQLLQKSLSQPLKLAITSRAVMYKRAKASLKMRGSKRRSTKPPGRNLKQCHQLY